VAKGTFWKTAPGVLTAIAGVITAVGGLLAILVQAGIIGGAGKTTSPQTTGSSVVGSSAAAPSSPSVGEATAVITPKEGQPVMAPARTLRFCISAGTGITLNDSQDIAFEKMSSLVIVKSDVALSPGGTATVHIVLAGGAPALDGTITSGCDFFAQTDLGRYSIYPDKLAKIEFH
jgi:hypothetical protein